MSLQTCSTCGRFYVPLGEYYVGDIVGEICPYNGRHPEITVTPQPYLFSEEMTRLHAEIDRLKAERKEFCPNCEAETPCTHEAELFVCDICGEDFAKYIVSRNCNVSDVSMTRDVSTDVKTPPSIENNNPDYYKDELYLDEDFRMLAKTYPADVSAIGVTALIDYVEALEAELAVLKSERRWIPVSERLPELHKPVLCCSNYNYVVMYSLANENRHYWYNERGWTHDFDSVTHWMPLPPPPEEE